MRAFGFRTWVGTFVGVMGLLVAGPADAHQPDTSYARFKVTRDSFTAKFSYDLSTLQRIVPKLDANGDYQVTAAELQAQVPAVFAFLQKHVRLEINGAATDFGEPQPVAFPPATNGSGSDSGNSDSGNRGSIAGTVGNGPEVHITTDRGTVTVRKAGAEDDKATAKSGEPEAKEVEN